MSDPVSAQLIMEMKQHDRPKRIIVGGWAIPLEIDERVKEVRLPDLDCDDWRDKAVDFVADARTAVYAYRLLSDDGALYVEQWSRGMPVRATVWPGEPNLPKYRIQREFTTKTDVYDDTKLLAFLFAEIIAVAICKELRYRYDEEADPIEVAEWVFFSRYDVVNQPSLWQLVENWRTESERLRLLEEKN